MSQDGGRLARLDTEEQKRELKELFTDADWEGHRMLQGLEESNDLYVGEIAQVKCPSWTRGRVSLLGDAGYCPSPVSGQGTTLAIIGAYVLAGCISTYSDDPAEVMKRYEEDMKPFVERSQKLLPGVPGIACPQTAWGIYILRTVIWTVDLISRSGIPKLAALATTPFSRLAGQKTVQLPTYAGLKGALSEKV